jgi:hypothetical protein
VVFRVVEILLISLGKGSLCIVLQSGIFDESVLESGGISGSEELYRYCLIIFH